MHLCKYEDQNAMNTLNICVSLSEGYNDRWREREIRGICADKKNNLITLIRIELRANIEEK